MALDEELYKEVGSNYRFFLGWRHATFAGYLIVLGAVVSFCVSAYKDAAEVLWLVPLGASPIGFLLWAVDVRTRGLYHAAIRAGKELEQATKGFYTHLADEVALPLGTSPFRQVTQSAALNILFLGGSVSLVALSALFYCKYA
jgi:hypothetical protein